MYKFNSKITSDDRGVDFYAVDKVCRTPIQTFHLPYVIGVDRVTGTFVLVSSAETTHQVMSEREFLGTLSEWMGDLLSWSIKYI